MKILLLSILSPITALLLMAPAQAALIAYDQFSGYTNGQLSGQGQGQGFGWAGNWSGNSNVTVSSTGDLNPAMVPTAGGGASTGTDETIGSWVGVNRTLVNPINTTGTYYFGFLIQQPVNGANHNLIRLQSTTGEQWAGAGSWNSSTNWQLVRRNGGSNYGNVNTGITETASVTHFVIRLQFDELGNESANLFVNPLNAAALSDSDDGSYSFTSQWADASVVNVSRNISSGNVGNMAFDEIRVGTTAADMFSVIPEPSAPLLGLLGSLLLLRRRR